MFTLLGQRFARWQRVDPAGTKCEIRAVDLLPHHNDGRSPQPTDEIDWPRWRYVGTYFQTGPYHAMGLAHPSTRLVEWLNEKKADYLTTYIGVMEEMAFAHPDASPCPSLRGVYPVASQVTDPMRRRVEASFGLPLYDSYGLNEIGIVASQCKEGRYHVHSDHCYVEITDDEGNPVAPGKRGRVLVTALRNPAMPLIRYDTDDSAVFSRDVCPCGRTLPTMESLVGRVRRYAVLPAGTRQKFDVLTRALENAPTEMIRPLRRYQVHQYRDGRFELRIVAAEKMSAEFHAYIESAWAAGVAEGDLQIVQVDEIPESRSGKRDDFTSDYFEDAQEAVTET